MSRISLSKRSAHVLERLAANSCAFEVGDDRALEELRSALAPRKPKPMAVERKKKRAAKKASKRDETSAIYAAVEKRADGKCEACGLPFSPVDPPELDHALGRGKVRQSVRNCWLIHRSDHHARHAGKPSRDHWLLLWASHCDRYGFRAEAAKARAELESEALVREAAAVGMRRG